MLEDEVTTLVKAHYAAGDPQLLLLSSLGKLLNDRGIQPKLGDRRSLREIVEQITDLSVVRDPEAVAFIAVVPKGEEKRAEDAIVERHRRSFLRRLPRALLLAFTLEISEGQIMSVQLGPMVVYHGGPAVAPGWIEVDSDLRTPGVDPNNIDAVEPAIVGNLEASIRAWCDRHQIDPTSLTRFRRKPGDAIELPETVTSASSSATKGTNALERLFQAQEPDVARRLNVPIDIALALSRML